MQDLEELGVVLPIKSRKERTELQKMNDAKTSQRMKEWHQKRREEKLKRNEILNEIIKEEFPSDAKEVKILPNIPVEEQKLIQPIVSDDELRKLCTSYIEKYDDINVKKLISKIEKKVKKAEPKQIEIKKDPIECFDCLV